MPTLKRFRQAHATARGAVCALSLVVLASCDDPVRLASLEGPPDVLEFVSGGFAVGGVTIATRGDTVVLVEVHYDDPVTRVRFDTTRTVPTAERWRAFWDEAAAAGVQRWQRRYENRDIVDGGGYTLVLLAGGRRIESTGSNRYPDRLGRGREWSEADGYRLFVAALYDLVGAQPRRW